MSGVVNVEDKESADQSAHINLRVKDQDGNEVFFRIKRSTQLKKLMNAYCDRQSVELNSIDFLFDGRRLRAEQTPDELEMEDRDEINIMAPKLTTKRKGAPSRDFPTERALPPRPSSLHGGPSQRGPTNRAPLSQGAPAQARQAPIGYNSNEFRNRMCQAQFELNMSNRCVIHSKIVNFKGWESLEIKEMFDGIGLHGLYELKGDSCDRIVHLFYANLTSTERSGCLKTYILGTEIVILPETINELLGFDGEGFEVERYYNTFRNCDFFRLPEGVEFLKKIHHNSNITKFLMPNYRDLNAKARVIHKLIIHTILPRDIDRDIVSCMDLYVMEKLYNEKMFDPGFVILSRMQEISLACYKNLPYDTLIQKIVERAQIQLPIGEQMIAQRSDDVFDRLHLIQMGLVEVDETWVLKENQGISTSRDVHMEYATARPLHPHTTTKWDKIEQRIEFLVGRVEELIVAHKELAESHKELRTTLMDWVERDDDDVPP